MLHRPFSLCKGEKMNYSPKHDDTKIRAIYGIFLVVGLSFSSVGTSLTKVIFTTLSLAFIATGLYLFIRHDLTSYSYIVMENEGRLDFYVDRTVGKRGAYVCYYPLCDAVLLERYGKDTKKALLEKYGKVYVYNYTHNRFCNNRHVIMFKNDGYYDAIICQLDGESAEYLSKGIEASRSDVE